MKDTILQFTARSTWLDVQNSLLSDSMEKLLIEAIKPIHPSKSVMIRKVQLIQSGVVTDEGPTLDEIHEDEKNASSERAAKKAAALEKAMAGEDDDEASDEADDDSESSDEDATDETEDEGATEAEEESSDDADDSVDEDLSALTVAVLKERCKAAGLKVGGKKADLIARLSE
jgi:hypothetical protein